MKKLLFFVLIAALFYFSNGQNDVDVDILEEDPLLEWPKIKIPKIKIPKWAKKKFEQLWNLVKNDAKKANKFLKENGIYDLVLDQLKVAGKEAAVGFCVSEGVPLIICQAAAELIEKEIEKHIN